jgi:Bacterial Ig domain
MGARAQAAEVFAASAEADSNIHYLNDSAGRVFTFTVNNIGTGDGIGAVSIRRPSNVWTVTACPKAPAGWSTSLSDVRCQYRSTVLPSDDIAPGASSSDFKLTATTRGGVTNRSGAWEIVVSRTSNFSSGDSLQASGAGAGLGITAYVWEVTDAVVAGSTASANSSCPAGNRSADASAAHVLVICGRNHADTALTPQAAHSSLDGSFVDSASNFSSGPVGASSSSDVVLGNWDVTVTGSAGTNKTVRAMIGSAPNATSPKTTFDGYEAIRPVDPPSAQDDSYDVAGNIYVQHDASTGVTANDFLDTATVSSVDDSTTAGDVTVDPDGGFVFDPDPGFEGVTAFDYTVTNTAGSDSATVTLTVSGPHVWFIDNTASSSGDGRLGSPFDSLGGFNAVQGDGGQNPESGDLVFLYEGDGPYDGGVGLLGGQTLVGQGVDLVYPADLPSGTPSLPAAAGKPLLINSAGDGVTVGSGNSISGLELGSAAGAKLVGTTFGTLEVDGVSTSGPGEILDLDTGTLDAVFDSLTSTASSGAAVGVTGVAGTLAVDGPTSITGAAGDGIVLEDSPAAQFTFAQVDVATVAGRALAAVNAGDLSVASASSTLSTAAGTALRVDQTTVTSTGLNFQSVDAVGGLHGIALSDTGSAGGLNVTGAGIAGSGGTIRDTTAEAVSLAGTEATLSSMTIAEPGGDGIRAALAGSSSLDLEVTDTLFRDIAGHSLVSTAGAAASGTTVVDFVGNQIDQTSPGHGGSVLINGRGLTSTTLSVTDNDFTGVGGIGLVNIDTTDSSTTSGTVARNAITNSPAAGVVVSVDESGSSTLVVEANDVTNSGSDGIQVANFGGPGTSSLDLVVADNSINGHNSSASNFFIAGVAVFNFEDDTCLALSNNTVLGTPVGFDSFYLDELDGALEMEEVPDSPLTSASAAYILSQGNVGDGPTSVIGTINLTNGLACARP